MPKVNNESITIIKNCDTLKVFKYQSSQNYYVSFYVSAEFSKNHMFEKSLRTKDLRTAIRDAKEIYRKFDKEKYKKVEVKISFDKDIADPFFVSRIKYYQSIDKVKVALKEQTRFKNYMKEIFDNVDYRNEDALEDAVNEVLYDCKLRELQNTTTVKYINLISLMLQKAFKRRVLPVLIDLPKLSRISEPREEYFPKEVKQITNAFDNEFVEKEDEFYRECSDYINFCRSSGIRPGLEPLRIKKFQENFINDPDNPTEPMLEFKLMNSKTGKKPYVSLDPDFVEQVYASRMMRRYKLKSDDYIFFPNETNREKLYERIRKNFARISTYLNLYYRNNKTRPMYALRHSFANNRLDKNVSVRVVAKSMNTSTKVLDTFYRSHSEKDRLTEHKKLFEDKYAKR